MSCACACSAPPTENENLRRCCKDEAKTDQLSSDVSDCADGKFSSRGIFDLIRNIMDPEHPLTLEALNVVNESHVEVIDEREVNILFTPTIPHCSMATIIGLAIRVKLLRNLPPTYKVSVKIAPGTHMSETPINKQLADKERVAAAMENKHLISVIDQCLYTDENEADTLYDKPATCGNPDAVSGTSS